MKTLFTTAIALIMAICIIPNSVNATDLVVAGGGSGGAYPTLASAIAAANPNDRIIVYPQPNGASYAEGTLTITKSLQILSANEGAFYTIDGNINITPATAGTSITIIGMRLLTGGIQTTISSPLGVRGEINILNDSLTNGTVSVNHDNYNLTCASNYIDAGVTFRFGKVIGNKINSQVLVYTDASVNNPMDTVFVIGNKINYYGGSNSTALGWYSTSQFMSIQNNFITLSYPANNNNFGIYTIAAKASSLGTNTIINNTVYKPTYSIYTAYSITTHSSSVNEFLNNLYIGSMYQYAFAFGAGTFNAHYNYATTFNWTGVTNDGTNIQALNTTINSEGLVTNSLSNTINGGTTDSAYVDLNLTRNDAGCYGGAYSLDNFFPITASDWARVIFVTAPRRVLLNGAINVKAIGFDK